MDYYTANERAKIAYSNARKAATARRHKTEAFLKDCKKEYDKQVPQLNIPASKDECLAAIQKLIAADAMYRMVWWPKVEQFGEIYTSEMTALGELAQLYGMIIKKFNKQDTFLPKIAKVMQMFGEAENMCLHLKSRDIREVILQETMIELVEGQSEELKEWFYTQLPSTQHLDTKESTRKAVTLKYRTHNDLFSRFPAEITANILEHCDLHSAVNLREANSFWYTAFNTSESTLERLVRARSPFFRPENDISSWADCALVFVRRLTGGKWVYLKEGLDDVKPVEDPVPPRPLVAVKAQGPLSESFSALESHDEACLNYDKEGNAPKHCASWCDHVRLEKGEKTAYLDAWTEKTIEHELDMVVERGEEQTIVTVRGVDIILDWATKMHEFRGGYVEFLRHYVIVHLKKEAYVIRREGVLNYDDNEGWMFNPKAQVTGLEVGQVVGIGQRQFFTTYEYNFFDYDNHDMFLYGGYTSSTPVAFYKGVCWWKLEGGKQLVATMADKVERKIYYRKDWTINMVVDLGELKQVQKQGNTQFLTHVAEKYNYIVDLEMRKTTKVFVPPGEAEKKTALFGGFVNWPFSRAVL